MDLNNGKRERKNPRSEPGLFQVWWVEEKEPERVLRKEDTQEIVRNDMSRRRGRVSNTAVTK